MKGDTLLVIAYRFGVSVDDVLSAISGSQCRAAANRVRAKHSTVERESYDPGRWGGRG